MRLINRRRLELEIGPIGDDPFLSSIGVGLAIGFLEWPIRIMIAVLFWQVFIRIGSEKPRVPKYFW